MRADDDGDYSPDVSEYEPDPEIEDSDSDVSFAPPSPFDISPPQSVLATVRSTSTTAIPTTIGHTVNWNNVTGQYAKKFLFTGSAGLKNIPTSVIKPIDVFQLYVN